jgi:hypothetical protein
LAKRQAQNSQTALQAGQKTACFCLNRFIRLSKYLFHQPDPDQAYFICLNSKNKKAII